MATFVCPKCSTSKTVNVSKYANLDKLVKVNVKCPCGHAYTSILEKRKQYRKESNLPGSYIHSAEGKADDRGLMTVKDVSATGLKLKLNVTQNFAIGDRMQVEFHLVSTHFPRPTIPQSSLEEHQVELQGILKQSIQLYD